jgi:hypothetical protein
MNKILGTDKKSRSRVTSGSLTPSSLVPAAFNPSLFERCAHRLCTHTALWVAVWCGMPALLPIQAAAQSCAVSQAGCDAGIAALQTPTSLTVSSATYLGLGAADTANATAIGRDCSVIVAGKFSSTEFGVTPHVVAGASSGAVLRLSTDGRAVRSLTRIGAEVADLDVRRTGGEIAVAGDAGAMLLSPDASAVLWAKPGAANRVAVADDGHVVALEGKTIRLYNVAGAERFSLPLSASTVNDVAIDSASGLVFVTGFNQKDGSTCSQLQVAWINAYNFQGELVWKNYDWTQVEAGNNGDCADTRGVRLALGADNKLYFAGTSAGGNSIFRHQPRNLTVAAPNVAYDAYTNPYQTRSNHITYYARLEPATGELLKGQFLLTRLTNNDGNTIEPRAIAADATGRVYIGGFAAFAIPNRTALQFNGEIMPTYAGSDAWMMIASPDLSKRELWTSFTRGGRGQTWGLAIGNGVASLAGKSVTAPMFVANALQPADPAPTVSSGYVAVWPTAR